MTQNTRNSIMSQQYKKRDDLKRRLTKERQELNPTEREGTEHRNNEAPTTSNTNPSNRHLPTHTLHQTYQPAVRYHNNTQPTTAYHQQKHSNKSQQTEQLQKKNAPRRNKKRKTNNRAHTTQLKKTPNKYHTHMDRK